MLYFPLMKIAVIGLGFMGSTHLKALKNVPEAELAAVVSSDEKKLSGDLSAIQGNIGGPGEKKGFSRVQKYHTLAATLAPPAIDVAHISLPPHHHSFPPLAPLPPRKHPLDAKP